MFLRCQSQGERFSGSSLQAGKQDFYGMVFLATLERILSKPVQAQWTARGEEREWTNPVKVKRAVSSSAVLDHVGSAGGFPAHGGGDVGRNRASHADRAHASSQRAALPSPQTLHRPPPALCQIWETTGSLT